MFQGGREARERNLKAWPFDPRQIDFVLLTHAHIDHSGLLPRLCALGFRGPIFTTRATVDLLAVMLLDSAFIQESEWARAQRRRSRQPRAAAPALLYTVAQAEACLEQLQGAAYDQDVQPHESVRCRFRDAGHILGSAILEIWVTERSSVGASKHRRPERGSICEELSLPNRPDVTGACAMKILVPADGSAQALDAVRHALRLRQDGLNASFVLATVQEPTYLYEMVLAPDADVLERVSGAVGSRPHRVDQRPTDPARPQARRGPRKGLSCAATAPAPAACWR